MSAISSYQLGNILLDGSVNFREKFVVRERIFPSPLSLYIYGAVQ